MAGRECQSQGGNRVDSSRTMTVKTLGGRPQMTPDYFNSRSAGHLPGFEGTEKRIALFRCTRMVLWPK